MEQEKQLHWFPGHMAKATNAIITKLPIIDVVIEILDARAPKASSSSTLNDLIKNKIKIVILNKIDRADDNITKRWMLELESQKFHVLAVNCLRTIFKNELIKTIDLALSEKIKIQRNKGIKQPHFKVLVLGLPNVGKSTFINNLVQRKITRTADSPGITRGQQWIKLNNNLDLLDTPGILPPKITDNSTSLILALIKSLPAKHLFLEEIASFAFTFMLKNYKNNLEEHYQVNMNKNLIKNEQIIDYFINIAKKYNFKITNDEYNINRAMSLFIQDLQSGKLGKVSFETPIEKNNE